MNPNLPRLKPNPIPKIAPVPEHLAEPALKEIYEDTKAALQTLHFRKAYILPLGDTL
jgi:hypothetical protein